MPTNFKVFDQSSSFFKISPKFFTIRKNTLSTIDR